MPRIFNTDTNLDAQNYALFKDCFASRVLSALCMPSSQDVNDVDELDDFASFLAADAWSGLPSSLRTLSHKSDEAALRLLEDDNCLALAPSPMLVESLTAYGVVPADETDAPDDAVQSFLRAVLNMYVPLALTPPPAWSATRASECEICTREVPLTYHHLVPRAVHARALKRGWHEEDVLNSVAWLCRQVIAQPCHSTVHSVASNEELAREFYTVERLLSRADLQKWRNYASKQRWGTRRG